MAWLSNWWYHFLSEFGGGGFGGGGFSASQGGDGEKEQRVRLKLFQKLVYVHGCDGIFFVSGIRAFAIKFWNDAM